MKRKYSVMDGKVHWTERASGLRTISALIVVSPVATLLLLASNSFCLGQMAVDNKNSATEVRELASGPLLDQRKQLYQKILESKQQGVGISGYLSAFTTIEQQVRQGVSSDKISQQIKSLDESLSAQLTRSKALKLQHPIPVQSKTEDILSKGTDGNAGTADKILKLKDKFKDQLENLPPGMIPDNLPDNLKEKLKDPKASKKLLEKLQGL